MSAVALDTDPAGDRHRTLAEQLGDPAVVVEYRPGAARAALGGGDYALGEIFGGPQGPSPTEVARKICRDLRRHPIDVLADPDPTDAARRCYVVDAAGDRLARLSGISQALLGDALLNLCLAGWVPGDRETVVAPKATAADRMPGPRIAQGQRPLFAPPRAVMAAAS